MTKYWENMSNVFLDFDGTLVNSQGRLYRLFCRLCPECNMSYDEYWQIKCGRISQSTMLKKYFGYDDGRIQKFHKEWLDHIEDEEAVDTDFPVAGMSERLECMARKHELYLLTARQRSELVVRQVERFGWSGHFRKLIVTRQACGKSDAVRELIGSVKSGVLIGDTGEDIKAAKALGFRSIAVGWGILSPKVLVEYKPDYLAERIEDLDNCPFI